MASTGGVIASVEPGSAAGVAGLLPGDRLLAIDGHPLRDVIDVQFYGAQETLDVRLERDGRPLRLRLERDYDRPLGLSFTRLTFDADLRCCANDCDFCFVKQNAPGLRPSLWVKDDDYRHSFLSSSFVTLTNLTGRDWARLREQRLSPLYVSVHATDPLLRRSLLGRKRAPDVLDQLRRLAELGIDVHTQVVLVPGVNDGRHLDRTVADLTALAGEPVVSLSVVPVGLTRFHAGGCRTYTAVEAQAVLDQVEPWRVESRRRWGNPLVYPSDEWYLVARRPVPPAADYDDFPQVENGVGMVRLLLDEWHEIEEQWAGMSSPAAEGMSSPAAEDLSSPAGLAATLACGTLIAPVLADIVARLNAMAGTDLRLVPVVNGTFGPVTTVSGLLGGEDVVQALRGRDLGRLVLLPRAMFTGSYESLAGGVPPGVTLDDLSPADLSAKLGAPVEMAGTLGEALAALSALRG